MPRQQLQDRSAGQKCRTEAGEKQKTENQLRGSPKNAAAAGEPFHHRNVNMRRTKQLNDISKSRSIQKTADSSSSLHADSGRTQLWVHAALIFVTASWGFNNIIMKIGFRELMAEQFAGIRMLAALPFMIYLAFFMPNHVPFERRDMGKIALISVFGMGMFQVLFPIGVDQTSAPVGGILMATMPIHVVIIGIVFRLERPKPLAILGVLITLGGLALITSASGNGVSAAGEAAAGGIASGDIAAGLGSTVSNKTTLLGIVMLITSEFGYAVNTTFLRPYMRKYPSLQVTGLALITATMLFMLINGRYIVQIDFASLSSAGWWAIIYSGLIPLFASNVLWNLSVKHIGSTRVSVYGNLPPVFVLIFGAVLLQQLLFPLQIAGAVIVLAGVILVQLR